MADLPDTRAVTQTTRVAAERVYAYARQMENMPHWAAGLADGVEQVDGHWYASSPMGRVRVDMAPENAFGVLDHVVTLPDGTAVHNAFRVTPCDGGSVLSFVVLRAAGASDEAFDKDVAHVRHDLQALARVLEQQSG